MAERFPEHQKDREDKREDWSRGAEHSLVQHEEHLKVSKTSREQGGVRVRKRVDTERVEEQVSRRIEDADIERTGPNPDDSGEIETLPDGSISIPVLEEELVISKRIVVRERIIIRKHVRTEQTQVEADLKREHVELEADPDIAIEGDRPS